MALGVKEGIVMVPACHDVEYQSIDIPQEHLLPGGLVVLAAYINHHRITERNCLLPNEGYLQAVGLHFALWGRDGHLHNRTNVGKNYSMVTALKSAEAVDEATSTINSCIRRLAFPQGGPYPQGLSDLMHVVGELHDNVWSHGRSTGFSFAQKSAVPYTDKKEHYLQFALADCGLGFLQELKRANILNVDTHQQAIEWCIKQGNSSKHADNIDEWAQHVPPGHAGGNVYGTGIAVREEQNNHQGLGLAHLMKLVNTYKGQLILASGNVCLVADGEDVSYETLRTYWQGVAISCRFKISDLALEQHDEEDPEIENIMMQLRGA